MMSSRTVEGRDMFLTSLLGLPLFISVQFLKSLLCLILPKSVVKTSFWKQHGRILMLPFLGAFVMLCEAWWRNLKLERGNFECRETIQKSFEVTSGNTSCSRYLIFIRMKECWAVLRKDTGSVALFSGSLYFFHCPVSESFPYSSVTKHIAFESDQI